MFNLLNIGLDSKNKEYFYYHSLLKNIINKKKDAEKEIDETLEVLEKEYSNYVTRIKILEQEIRDIRLKKEIEFEENEENLDKENLNNDENKENTNEQIITDDQTINNKTIKKLFRNICTKCHPDKTDDVKLNDLFIIANDAMNKHNYSIIIDIYNRLSTNNIENINISLDDKLTLIKKQFEKEKEDYNLFTRLNTFIINKLYRSDNAIEIFKARQLFSEILFNRMVELENTKQAIE
jgi:hypothetical protein